MGMDEGSLSPCVIQNLKFEMTATVLAFKLQYKTNQNTQDVKI